MRAAVVLTLVTACGGFVTSAAAQQPANATPVAPPPMTATQLKSLAALPTDVRVYEEFRYWRSFQSPELADPLRHYDAFLVQLGVSPAERASRLGTIETQGRRLEVDRWNRILTAEQPAFNTRPNAFLVEVLKGRQKGRALDVGMGQGRNALYLAEQGWDVTGFDPAEQAVAAAQAAARRQNLKVAVQVVGAEDFDWGTGRWDVIVLSYVTVRPYVRQIIDALAPGGVVVLEAFHRDALKTGPIGGGVVYDSNELVRMFDGLRILRYEDQEAEPDFGPRGQLSRAVRLLAQKP